MLVAPAFTLPVGISVDADSGWNTCPDFSTPNCNPDPTPPDTVPEVGAKKAEANANAEGEINQADTNDCKATSEPKRKPIKPIPKPIPKPNPSPPLLGLTLAP